MTDLDRLGWAGWGRTDGEDSRVRGIRPPPEQLDPDRTGMFGLGDGERQIQSSSHGPGFDLIGESRTIRALPRSFL